MPTADILTIADAIVAQLNAATFDPEFSAVRSYFATKELPSEAGLTVTVMPATDETKLVARTQSGHDYTYHVAVQQRLDDLTNATIDPLMLLTQQIADFFLYGKRPGSGKLVSPQIRIIFNETHLREYKQFTAVIALTFKLWRGAT